MSLQEAVQEAGVAVDTSFGLGVTVDKTEGQEGRVHLVHIGQTAEGTCGVRAALSLGLASIVAGDCLGESLRRYKNAERVLLQYAG